MSEVAPALALEGFHAMAALWIWALWVALHVLFRLWHRPGPDPLRDSGPGG